MSAEGYAGCCDRCFSRRLENTQADQGIKQFRVANRTSKTSNCILHSLNGSALDPRMQFQSLLQKRRYCGETERNNGQRPILIGVFAICCSRVGIAHSSGAPGYRHSSEWLYRIVSEYGRAQDTGKATQFGPLNRGPTVEPRGDWHETRLQLGYHNPNRSCCSRRHLVSAQQQQREGNWASCRDL